MDISTDEFNWENLCNFLGRKIPSEDFPFTRTSQDEWDKIPEKVRKSKIRLKESNEKIETTTDETYWEADKHIDYGVSKIKNEKYTIRGNLPKDEYISFLGSSFTFGRNVKNPFSKTVGERLNIETLNLSKGGASISSPFFFDNLDLFNKSKICVIQVLSARGHSCSKFKPEGQRYGLNIQTGEKQVAKDFWEYAIETYSRKQVIGLIDETLNNFVTSSLALII